MTISADPQAAAAVRDQGVLIQHVEPTLPLEVPYAYTVGASEAGVAELIVFGLDAATSATLLTRAFQMAADGTLTAGDDGTVIGVLDEDRPIRLIWVSPAWPGVYAPRAVAAAADARFVQVLLPDRDDRFVDDPDVDPWWVAVQPLLAEPTLPWRTPASAPAHTDLFPAPEGTLQVLVPVCGRNVFLGRVEQVACERVDDTHVRVTKPPVLADHVNVGDVLTVEPLDGVADVVVGREVTSRSRLERLSYVLMPQTDDDRDMAVRTIQNLAEQHDDAVVTTTTQSVHICATKIGNLRARFGSLIKVDAAVEVEGISTCPDSAWGWHA